MISARCDGGGVNWVRAPGWYPPGCLGTGVDGARSRPFNDRLGRVDDLLTSQEIVEELRVLVRSLCTRKSSIVLGSSPKSRLPWKREHARDHR